VPFRVISISNDLPEASSVPAVALSLDSAELVHDYTILLLRFNSKVPCD
jgi:hypothetical protein